MAEETITVLIVDDHLMVRKGLALFISGFTGMRLAGEAANAAAALELYRQEHPDVVLMDLVMPGDNGATAIQRIIQEFPQAAIIALTSFAQEQLIAEALRAGARGFLYKSISAEDLADTIRQVHAGRTILDPQASEVLLKMLHDTPAAAESKPNLSERESDVLHLLIQGCTNKQIASQLQIKPSTVKQYLEKIFAKLNVSSRAEAVAVFLQFGLVKK